MATTNAGFNLWVAITKSDTVNFNGSTGIGPTVPTSDAIYVGGAGIVEAVQANGQAVQFTAVAGEILPIQAIRVNSANTTATLMVALYAN